MVNTGVTFPHKVRMLKNLHAVDVREAPTRCGCEHNRCAGPGVLKAVHALPTSDPQPLPAESALEGSSEPRPRVGVRALWPRVGGGRPFSSSHHGAPGSGWREGCDSP